MNIFRSVCVGGWVIVYECICFVCACLFKVSSLSLFLTIYIPVCLSLYESVGIWTLLVLKVCPLLTVHTKHFQVKMLINICDHNKKVIIH